MKIILIEFDTYNEVAEAEKKLGSYFDSPASLQKMAIISMRGHFNIQTFYFPPLATKNLSCLIFMRDPGERRIKVIGEEQDILMIAAILGIPLSSVCQALDALS